MANQKLTKEYWEKKDELIQAAVRGWNPIQRIPVLLREAYADLKGIDFGFFVEADIPERMSMGWEFLSKDMFDADELNSVLPARYGIEEVGGRFKWQNNYLMIMGKDFRKRLIAARNQAQVSGIGLWPGIHVPARPEAGGDEGARGFQARIPSGATDNPRDAQAWAGEATQELTGEFNGSDFQ
jgi:hypothetical protein